MSDSLVSHSPSSSPDNQAGLTEWLNYMQQIHVSAIDMGLSRVLPVAEALGVVQSAKDGLMYLQSQALMVKAQRLQLSPRCAKPQDIKLPYINHRI